MADSNDNNDSYEFPELDGYSPDNVDTTEEVSSSQVKPGATSSFSGKDSKEIWRNALIVLASVLVLMFVYKYIGGMFSDNKKATPKIASVPKITQPVINTRQSSPKPSVEPSIPVESSMNAKPIKQKLARLELSQQNMSNNVSDIESKLNGLGGNVSDLAQQLATINQQLSGISEKLDEQAQAIHRLKVRTTHKPKPKRARYSPPPIRYFIQAVIPGRAWLIGSNGSTITVSKGSRIANYGRVRMIDAQEGRVMTSSGKVIQFENVDS